MLRADPEFKRAIFSAGLSVDDLADRAGLQRSTLYAWLNPKIQAKRKIGIRPKNAWDVARAYAKIEGITKEEAFKRLFVEEPGGNGHVSARVAAR